MSEYITHEEHDAEIKRLDAENDRQNHRIEELEKVTEKITNLTVSVEKMAVSTENMSKELSKQGERLEAMESRDGQSWRNIKWYVVTAIVGAVVGYLLKQISGI